MSDGASRHNLTTNIAFAYIEAETKVLTYFKAVKDVFHDKKEKYHDFLKVMTDFQSKRCHILTFLPRPIIFLFSWTWKCCM